MKQVQIKNHVIIESGKANLPNFGHFFTFRQNYCD